MKTTINRVDYQGLWNSEFPVVVQRTIGIAAKYDMAGMHLGKSFGELQDFVPQLENMKKYVRRNEKIEEAGIVDSERDTLVKVINKVVQAFEPVQIAAVKQYHTVLAALLEKHQVQKIATANLTAETEQLNLLEKDYAANVAVQEAAAALGLAPVMQRLFEANHEYEAIFREFIAGKSTEEHIDTAALRNQCGKALGQFFDAVQYCAYEHDEINYLPLVNELNTLNGYYRTQLKARATRRKNNQKDKGNPIPPPPEA